MLVIIGTVITILSRVFGGLIFANEREYRIEELIFVSH